MVHHDHHHDENEHLASETIPNCANEKAVADALMNVRAAQDPAYVQGVIESYVANKQKQGEDPAEVTQKLVFIAQKDPHFKNIIDKVISEKGLPKLQL